MISPLSERVVRARELVETVRHAAIATVNQDGSPHNSPVFAAFDKQLRMYWASCPDSAHSQNIERTGQAFVVLFDALNQGGGLYIRGYARALDEHELAEALVPFNAARTRFERLAVGPDHFTGTQRLYVMEPDEMWVNLAERDESGNIICDTRHPVSLADIFAE